MTQFFSFFYDTNLQISSPFLCVQVQTKEIEGIFRYGWTLCDGCAFLLHEAQQLVEEGPAIGMIVHFVEAGKAVRAPGGRLCIGKNKKTQLLRVLHDINRNGIQICMTMTMEDNFL